MSQVRLVVFDMAGTTVHDEGEVVQSFLQAAQDTGLEATPDEIRSMMGWSKRQVFQTLWARQLGETAADLTAPVDRSYDAFRRILESHYETQSIRPCDGCLECFEAMHGRGIAVALTTGFYRKVTDIILRRLAWDEGLDARQVGSADTLIQSSVCSDEVPQGRPAPDMILRTMDLLGIADPASVVKIGDTPSDLQAGKNAGCALTLGVTGGSHTAEQLREHPNDGLLSNVGELPAFLRSYEAGPGS